MALPLQQSVLLSENKERHCIMDECVRDESIGILKVGVHCGPLAGI